MLVVSTYSEVGKGTTFRICVPAQIAAEGTTSPRANESLPRGSGEWILIVDDEPSILEVTARTLRMFGYQVMVASAGSDALRIYARNQKKIVLVITDMMMPEGDGGILIHSLLQFDPGLKIIASSGLDASNGDEIKAIGAKYFLAKPYAAQLLIKAVHEVLEPEARDDAVAAAEAGEIRQTITSIIGDASRGATGAKQGQSFDLGDGN